MTRHGSWYFILLVALLSVNAGCSKTKTPEVVKSSVSPTPSLTAAPTVPMPDDFACTLLTKDDAQAVQGEPFKSTKPSQQSGSGLLISQCYFELPTTVNSIVLTVTRKAPGGRDPRDSWNEIFHRERPSKEKEEEGREPTKVEGVGDEAFWTGTRVGGALYVLAGNAFIRISVGGAGDQAQKIEKTKALAQSVLKRL